MVIPLKVSIADNRLNNEEEYMKFRNKELKKKIIKKKNWSGNNVAME